jgi:hypothetical protein
MRSKDRLGRRGGLEQFLNLGPQVRVASTFFFEETGPLLRRAEFQSRLEDLFESLFSLVHRADHCRAFRGLREILPAKRTFICPDLLEVGR